MSNPKGNNQILKGPSRMRQLGYKSVVVFLRPDQAEIVERAKIRLNRTRAGVIVESAISHLSKSEKESAEFPLVDLAQAGEIDKGTLIKELAKSHQSMDGKSKNPARVRKTSKPRAGKKKPKRKEKVKS